MAMSTGQGGPELNVTPLIDVLLVLLIIFLIIATEMKPKGEDALVPQPPTSTKTPDIHEGRTIVIRLLMVPNSDRPDLKINDEPVTWEQLHDRLMEVYARRMEKVAFVQANKDVEFHWIADVIDVAHSVEIDKVGLMPEPQVETASR
jgi:biopolymer transport protein ExbD